MFPRVNLSELTDHVVNAHYGKEGADASALAASLEKEKAYQVPGMKGAPAVHADQPDAIFPAIPPPVHVNNKTPGDPDAVDRWYVVLESGTAGPFNVPKLRQMYRSGAVDNTTLFWCEGELAWKQLQYQLFLRPKLLTLPALPVNVGALDKLYTSSTQATVYESQGVAADVRQTEPLTGFDIGQSCFRCGSMAVVHIPTLPGPAPDLFKNREEGGVTEHTSEVLPGFLWVGNSAAAKQRSIYTLKITLLVNLTGNMKNPEAQPPAYRCRQMELRDTPRKPFNARDMNELLCSLEKIYDWVEAHRLTPELASKSDPTLKEYRGPTDKLGLPIKTADLKVFRRPKDGEKPVFEPRVLLWSRVGTDRPCVVAAAYLVKHYRIPVPHALHLVKAARPTAAVSSAYHEVLQAWSRRYTLGMLLCLDCKENFDQLHEKGGPEEETEQEKEGGGGDFDLSDDEEEQIGDGEGTLIGSKTGKGGFGAKTGKRAQSAPQDEQKEEQQTPLDGLIDSAKPAQEDDASSAPSAPSAPSASSRQDSRLTLPQLEEAYAGFVEFLSVNMGFMLKASENAHEATVLANPDLYLRRVQSAIVAPGRGLPAFQWGALLDLELSGRHLSDKTMAVLFQGLGADRLIRRVRSLKLASNLIKDLALKALLIAYFPNVHMADDSCRFDEYMLVSEMDPDIDLMVLDLSNNRIDEFGVPYLMDLLRMCCSLMTFSVASNNLDEFLCAELVRCLARPKEDFEEDVESTYAVSYGYAGAKLDLKVHNSSITDANFGHNVFGQAAADELTNMLKNNAVLRSLSLEHSPAIEPSMWKPILTALRLYNSVLEELVLSDNRLSVKTAQYIGRVFESKDTQVNKLILSNCGLSHKHMTALCDPLAQSSTLTYLDISNNKIGDKGCEFLALVVGQGDESKGPPLHTLDFSGCSFGSAGCAELLEAVATRKLLPRLDLSSNGFGAENSAGVKALLQCRVTDLRLHCCGLRSGTASAIFTALAQQGTQCLLASSVRSLGLSGNEISDSAAEALCLLLMHNRVLELLDLGFNELTDQKQPLFLQATRITSTSADFKKVLGLTVSLQGNKCDPYMLDTPGMSRAKANLLFGLRPGETDAAHRGFSHVTSYSRAHFLARKQLDEYYQQSLPSMELNHIT